MSNGCEDWVRRLVGHRLFRQGHLGGHALAQEHFTPTFVGTHRGDATGDRISDSWHRRGLTLVELLVTFAIVSILLSLLLPGLSQAQSAARRLMCAANQSHVGIAIALDSDQNNQRLVRSWFAEIGRPSETMAATVGDPQMLLATAPTPAPSPSADLQLWDGLGKLAYRGSACLDSHEALYCPCHRGDHPLEVEGDAYIFRPSATPWMRFFTNYQYAGHLHSNGDPKSLAVLSVDDVLVADGFRSMLDVNHTTGSNVLRGDLSVRWWASLHDEFTALPTNSDAALLSDSDVIDPDTNPWKVIWSALRRDP